MGRLQQLDLLRAFTSTGASGAASFAATALAATAARSTLTTSNPTAAQPPSDAALLRNGTVRLFEVCEPSSRPRAILLAYCHVPSRQCLLL